MTEEQDLQQRRRKNMHIWRRNGWFWHFELNYHNITVLHWSTDINEVADNKCQNIRGHSFSGFKCSHGDRGAIYGEVDRL